MKNPKKLITLFSTAFLSLFVFAKSSLAQIKNPAVGEKLGGDDAAASSGATFASYLVTLWNAIITLGALAVILFFIWGAIEWISAGGDSGKLEKARGRILQSAIGLLILVSSYTIIGFLGSLLFGDQFNILNLSLPKAGQVPGTP